MVNTYHVQGPAPRPPRPPFAGFVAPPKPPPIALATFKGLAPKVAVERLMSLYGDRREMSRFTIRQKRAILTHIEMTGDR